MQELEDMDDYTREMYDMVKKFHKAKPIRVRDPSLIINQDDTTDYFCLGVQNDKKSTEKGIVASSGLPVNYTHSTHHHEDSHKMNGMLGNCFNIGKSKNKRTTVEHIMTKNHPLKRRLTSELKRLSDMKLFRHPKHAHIVDHFSIQPEVLQTANLSHNIVIGWIANGIIDSKQRQYPVLKKVIAICKKVPKMEDYELNYSAFDALLDYTVNNENQHISDEVCMSYGFPSDIDAHGESVVRSATVSQENQQRAKILTAEAEARKRTQRDNEIELAKRRKDNLAQSRADNVVNGELAVISKLCGHAGLEASEDNVRNCQIEHFSKLKKDE